MNDNELDELIQSGNENAHQGRIERLRFLVKHQPCEPFRVAALAYEYYEEARLCWLHGAFVATIVMSQLSFEEMLRSHFRVSKGFGGKFDDKTVVESAGFAQILKESKKEGTLTEEEFRRLDGLRKSRNPYVHAHDTNPGKCNQRDWLTQLLKISAPSLTELSAVDEARAAISVLVTLLPSISVRLGGM